jgi:hypothetical protein
MAKQGGFAMTTKDRCKPALALRLPLFVEWHTDRYILRHDALTESITANGALVRVFSSNPPAQKLVLKHPESGQQIPARLVALQRASDGFSFMLRVEFAQSLLDSWQLPNAN